MDIQYYEMMMKKHHGCGHGGEASWDSRAKAFGMHQKKSGRDNSGKVTALLLEKGLLKGLDVLDVGGGTGRYAIPFAEYANQVTITDISSQMLECTKENADAAGRTNLNYKKLNWEEADLKTLGWENQFDLVFASMCPAIRSKDGIDKMTNASKGWCQINQLIKMTDNITQRLEHDLDATMQYDPHNDREVVQGTFNILWLEGFCPEIAYLNEEWQQVLSIEEAEQRYSHRFSDAAKSKGLNLRNLLEKYSHDGSIAVDNMTSLAIILWKASDCHLQKTDV